MWQHPCRLLAFRCHLIGPFTHSFSCTTCVLQASACRDIISIPLTSTSFMTFTDLEGSTYIHRIAEREYRVRGGEKEASRRLLFIEYLLQPTSVCFCHHFYTVLSCRICNMNALTKVGTCRLDGGYLPNDALFCDAFQELNGLTIIVQTESNSSGDTSPTSVLSPYSVSEDESTIESDHREDILLKALESPFPSFSKTGLEAFAGHEDLCYLNLAPAASSTVSDGSSTCTTGYPRTSTSFAEQYLGPGPVSALSSIATSEKSEEQPNRVLQRSEPLFTKNNCIKAGSNSGKRYKVTQPSKFCHVCVRSGEQVTLAPCANVTTGLCRKAICKKCFGKHGFGNEWDVASANTQLIRQLNAGEIDQLPGNAWTCLHCRSLCPSTAQCRYVVIIYSRKSSLVMMGVFRAAATRTRCLSLY